MGAAVQPDSGFMEKILFLAHTEPDGGLAQAALEALHGAKALCDELKGASLEAGLVGAQTQPAADTVGGIGVARVFVVTGGEFAAARYASDAVAAEAIARTTGATIVVAAATSRWNRVLPAVACRLGGRADAHVAGVQVRAGALTVSRWYYRQRMEARLSRAQRPWFLLLDPGGQPPWQGTPTPTNVEALTVPVPESCRRTQVTGIRAPATYTQTIRPDAELLFVAGAGWTKKQGDGQTHGADAERLILEFLRLSRASLGSSKSLVDLSGEGQTVLSFLSHLNQVGQTGSTPRHPKGLATCCHGEEPHTVGWRFVGQRRAINLDPNCGWARGKADVLYAADAFAVMARVNSLLGAGGR
jgi:electron transfer flavoprotein alpha subunit